MFSEIRNCPTSYIFKKPPGLAAFAKDAMKFLAGMEFLYYNNTGFRF